MTRFNSRKVLILLAGAALTACATPRYPITPSVAQVTAAAPVQPPAPQVAAVEDAAPRIPQAAAPVESRPLEALPPAQASPSAPASALAEVEDAPVLAIEPPAQDAAARAKSRERASASAEADSSYTVRRGDTLEKIAARLGTDIPALAKTNGLRKPYRLMPGQVLINPAAPEQKATARRSAKVSTSGAPKTYVVRSGDTLFAIARRFGTSVEALREANGLGQRSSIARGQTLRLPGGEDVETAEAVKEEVATRRAEAAPASAEPGRIVTGRVVTIAAPGKAYRVRRGDTLEKVARKLNSDVPELARLNKLKRPYRLRPGQTIRAPGGSAKAYVVAGGDTLAQIARRFDVSVEELRAANGLRRGASVASGRKLRLPAGYRDRGPLSAPVRTTVAAAPPSSLPTPPPRPEPQDEALPSAPQPYTGQPTPPPPPRYTPPAPRTYTAPAAAPTPSPPVSEAQIMQMGRGLFAWPLRGEVISGFGGKGGGQRNDGLNIRAAAGDPVRAAAAGDVVYAGDQVPGFGNLILIKHADGWVTAYGHLSRVDVRMQQKVTQGQQIGQAGSTGGVSEPQLHFEVRHAPTPQERARPVDPQLVLPQ